MKILIPFFLSLILSSSACSSSDHHAQEAKHLTESLAGLSGGSYQENEPYITKNFTITGAGSLQVKTSGGNITVSGSNGNRISVEMYVHKSSWGKNRNAKEVEEALQNFMITISQSGNTVMAIAEKKSESWFKNNNVSISFVVQVPHQIVCDLRTSGGNITLQDVDGKQEVRTSGGNITTTGVNGDMLAHTSGGNIVLQSYKGTLEARTSGGNIRLEDGMGDLKLHTSGGNIRLSGIAGGINASTSGGSITAEIINPKNFINLSTSGGNVTVTVPQGIGMDVDIRGSKVNTSFQDFKGDLSANKVTGKVNGGGIPVELRTSGGSINLVQR
jgi:DUF4097 and DUF4098 domain-containing protein YvlB